MKKFLFVLMILMLVVIPFVPVQAAGTQPIVWVSDWDYAYQGDLGVISVVVKDLSRPSTKLDIVVSVPKATVDGEPVLHVGNQKVVTAHTNDSWVYEWKNVSVKKRNDNTGIDLGIVFSKTSSGILPLVVVTSNKVLVDENDVEIKKPALVWMSTAPSYINVNTKFELVLTATNNSQIPLSFDIKTQINFLCTDRSVFPSEYPVLAYDGLGKTDFYYLKWKGEVPPATTFVWKFQLGSGRIGCIDNVFVLSNVQDGINILSQKLTVY